MCRSHARARHRPGRRLALLTIPCLLHASAVLAPAAHAQTGGTAVPELRVTEQEPRAGESATASKTPTSVFELPLSVEVLDQALIERAQDQTLAEVLQSGSTALMSPGEGNFLNEIMLRGFDNAAIFRDGFNDSLGSLTLRDIANVESIEILKGPVGALYGPGEPGGSVNLVTKQPQSERGHELILNAGGFSRLRLQADSTGPLGADARLLYRLIGALEEADSFRDFVDSRRQFLAPSLSWRPAARVELDVAAEVIEQKTVFDQGVPAVNGRLVVPGDRFFGEPGDGRADADGVTLDAGISFAIDEHWTLDASLYWQHTELRGATSYPAELLTDPEPGSTVALAREFQRLHDEDETLALQTELSGAFRLGNLENAALLGFEMSWLDVTESLDASDPEAEPFAVEVFGPDYGQQGPALQAVKRTVEDLDRVSVYVQDQISLGPFWRVLAGTRYDHIELRGHDRAIDTQFDHVNVDLRSRLGVVYLLRPWLSLYGSYSESLDPNEGVDVAGKPLKPTRGRSFETGFKIRHVDPDLSLTVSLYDISQKHVSADDPDNPGFEIQPAGQDSRGVEIALASRPRAHLRLRALYTYTDAAIRDDPGIPDGTRPVNVPEHSASLSLLGELSWRRAGDLSYGATINYVGRRQGSLDPEELDFELPDYWSTNLLLAFRPAGGVELQLRVENVFDENYYLGTQGDSLTVLPGAPLTATGSLRFEF